MRVLELPTPYCVLPMLILGREAISVMCYSPVAATPMARETDSLLGVGRAGAIIGTRQT
jgi:hypothetical protein